MAFVQCNFYSHALEMCSTVNVIIPQPPKSKGAPRRKYQVLYLLHGLSDDHTIWQRRTSVERYAEPYELAVVMPAAERSFYADIPGGLAHWQYISEELPHIISGLFPVSTARADTFVAGLSMGGYGAFKLALTNPHRFAAAASFSGCLDIVRLCSSGEFELNTIFGGVKSLRNSQADLFHLASRLAKSRKPHPQLYQWCGTSDMLYGDNLKFRDHAAEVGLETEYSEGPGDHSWQHWDDQIRRLIPALPGIRKL